MHCGIVVRSYCVITATFTLDYAIETLCAYIAAVEQAASDRAHAFL